MAANSTEICNLALQRVGAGTITALTDLTAEGKACNRHYARTLQAVLTLYDWPFATKLASLGTETNTDPVSGWLYEYTAPSDMIRPIRLEYDGFDVDADTPIDFELRGAKILTDLEDAQILYVWSITTTTLFPLAFEEVLINRLAVELAMPLTGDPNVADRTKREYRESLISAAAIFADEPTELPIAGSFLTGRF